MAEGSSAAKEGLERLKGEITCPLCLEIFGEPKVLPCHHVYCKTPCLEGLAQRSGNRTISCPECRKETQVPGNDVNNFPTAFHINRLIEVYKAMEKDKELVPCCEKHNHQPLALYCETCEAVICRDCVLADRHHANHEYGYVVPLAEKYKKAILNMLKPLQQRQADISQALAQISATKSRIVESKAEMAKEINDAFAALIDVIQEERDVLLQRMEGIMEKKRDAVAAQEKELESTQVELQKVTSSVEHTVNNARKEGFLLEKKQIAAKIKHITEKAQGLTLSPVEKPDMGVQVVDTRMLRNVCKEFSFTYQLANPSKCTAEGDGLQSTETDKVTTVKIHLVNSKGNPCNTTGKQKVAVKLKSLRQGSITTADVTFLSPGQYEASYKAETRGRHELSIKVNDVHIPNSPFPVSIQKPVHQLKVPVAVIPGLNNAAGLAYSNGEVFALEYDGCRLNVLSCKEWKIVRTIGEGYLRGPTEVAVDHQSNVYVCTAGDHKLHKLNKEGMLLKSVGGEGNEPGKFRFPNGNRVRGNKLFVCDSRNHRIQIFDTELNLQRIIGSQGTKSGRFDFPADVDFDSNGTAYIVDFYNHRIQAMTPDGRSLYTIGKKGSAAGELHEPVCIQVRDQLLYLTEKMNNRVSVFRTSGQFVTTFGGGYLQKPEGLTIDEDGFVYVTSHESKVLVF